MRIDELELRQRARVVLEFLHLKQAEPMVRERRAGGGGRQRECQRRGVSRMGARWHGQVLQLRGSLETYGKKPRTDTREAQECVTSGSMAAHDEDPLRAVGADRFGGRYGCARWCA